MGLNIDGWIASRQCMLAVELEDEKELGRLLAKRQIHQYFPINKLSYMPCQFFLVNILLSFSFKILQHTVNSIRAITQYNSSYVHRMAGKFNRNI